MWTEKDSRNSQVIPPAARDNFSFRLRQIYIENRLVINELIFFMKQEYSNSAHVRVYFVEIFFFVLLASRICLISNFDNIAVFVLFCTCCS